MSSCEQVSEKHEDSCTNDDLTDLLNEAESTILQLQEESKTLKSEIHKLRQQNLEYNKQIDALQKQTITSNVPETIPLEPIIIIKDNKNISLSDDGQDKRINNEFQATINTGINISEKSSTSYDSSQSDNTFVM